MIVYNVTVLLAQSVEQQWLNWLKPNYIDQVMQTGFFDSWSLLQVNDSPNEGLTYCLQFITEEISSLQAYRNLYEESIAATHQQEFKNQLVTFSSTMQSIILE